METKYYIEIKGVKENKFNWEFAGVFFTLKEALRHYNFFKSGCMKRIRKLTIIEKSEIVRSKKY